MQDNLIDIAGPGEYRAPFVELLNRRLAEYARASFEGDEPGYDMLRMLGAYVLEVMPAGQTNRWVIDQIMAITAPDVAKRIAQSVTNLFAP